MNKTKPTSNKKQNKTADRKAYQAEWYKKKKHELALFRERVFIADLADTLQTTFHPPQIAKLTDLLRHRWKIIPKTNPDQNTDKQQEQS